MYNFGNVLVTEADWRTMLSVIRNLKKILNLKINAVGRSKSGGILSRYCSNSFIVKDKEQYKQLIKNLAEQEPELVIFPHLEETYLYLYSINISNIIIAPPKNLAYKITNKLEVFSHIQHKFPEITPYSVFLSIGNQETFSKVQKQLEDFLLKTRKAILKVTSEINKPYGPYNRYVVLSKDNLEKTLNSYEFKKFLLENKDFILQEYIDGYGIGIGGVWFEGEPVCIGGHRRLLQSHGSEGISIIAESYINNLALRYGNEIMQSLKYTGIALIEFRLRIDNKIYFMEINPRVWGTLPLYIYSGLNIPSIAYQIFKYGSTKNIPLSKFIEGRKMIFFKDYLLANYNKGLKEFCKAVAYSPYLLCKYKEGTFDIKDPLPFLFDTLSIALNGLRKIWRHEWR